MNMADNGNINESELKEQSDQAAVDELGDEKNEVNETSITIENSDFKDSNHTSEIVQAIDNSNEQPPEGKTDAKVEANDTNILLQNTSFQDLHLKPEILHAIDDCGFEHPSEVQLKCLPQAVLGVDILCQARSGMGKSTAFVLASLQQLDPTEDCVYVLVICHSRDLAFQISKEYERLSKYMPQIKVEAFFGGSPMEKNKEVLDNNCPHIVVGTPGRILALINCKKLNLKHTKHFILDECDKMLHDMRHDVLSIFRSTPREKQVMLFGGVLNDYLQIFYKKLLQNPLDVVVDGEAKLTLHGLQHRFVRLKEDERKKKLCDLLEVLKYNQVTIFVQSVQSCKSLTEMLHELEFPAITIHKGLTHEEGLLRYQKFKDCHKGVLVATTMFGKWMDTERVNIVFNYDMAEDCDIYLQRLMRASSRGLVITFVGEEGDSKILSDIEDRFDIKITELHEEDDISPYSTPTLLG